jgi:hypothetical protein
MAEFRFSLESGVDVLAFSPFDPASDGSITALRESLENLSDVAAFVSTAPGRLPKELRQVALLWDRDRWRLAWWASESASYVTPWFQKHAPAPKRFLGYTPPTLRLLGPYMPQLPGAEPVEQEPEHRPVASAGMSGINQEEPPGEQEG